MLRLKNRKAQSTAEYVVVLGLIVAAVVAMQTYIKRGFQARIKDAVDYVDQGGQAQGVVKFTGNQYEPYYLSSNFESTRSASGTEELLTAGAAKRTSNEESARIGNQTIGATK